VISALRRAIVEVRQRGQSLDGCPIIYYLKLLRTYFGRHVKPLVPAAFSVVSTYQPALGTRGGLWPVLLMCNSSVLALSNCKCVI
jgi:hypothetical protein